MEDKRPTKLKVLLLCFMTMLGMIFGALLFGNSMEALLGQVIGCLAMGVMFAVFFTK